MASHDLPVVKILEISQVSPFINSANSLTHLSIPLTFFDVVWIKFPPMETLFFYQFTGLTLLRFNSEILPKLKHSLSLALGYYLPLAGKVTWPPHAHIPTISYSKDDTVSVHVEESNADFNRLSGDDIHESSESRHLIPELLTSDESTSSMAVQITLFPNQGFCIGVAMHHAVSDGATAIAFLKSWAYLSANLGKENPNLSPELTPYIDRTVVKDHTGICMMYLKHLFQFNESDNLEANQRSLKLNEDLGLNRNSFRATFKLTREDIKKLREKILSTKQLHLSTFVITYAYVLVCFVKAKEVEGHRNVHFIIPVDCRSRLDPPLPQNYLGNCVYFRDATLKAGVFMEENGVAKIAEKISDMIRDIEEKELLEGAEEGLEKLAKIAEAEEQMFTIAGSNRSQFYGVDLGWGRPKKIEVTSIDRTGSIAMSESGDGNGVEIGLVSSSHEMESFKSVFVSGLQYV
ncbi:phenolic glucoside malonyltransferase 1-like [Mangifera indica]|uniref:phenolic glucoside malonyltransferase 1-like n=1 Tax=Mangifera indica TaxID=29780 RepID=UPI001CFBC57C|nr:phenolic glucoside malonyltransferase 1-like [Mangifera indica]